jgi:D-cysteine desulfhydrase
VRIAGGTQLQTDLDRVPLVLGPTPVRELTGLGEGRGKAPVWIKDDGAYSSVGGNKARKLEWLLAEALRRRKRSILTSGATGTNHGLATATFARQLGLRTILVLVPQPETDHVRAQLERLRESGAEIHIAAGFWSSFPLAAWLALTRGGPGLRPPYLVPPGGSSPLGCVGYVQAAFELADQVSTGALPEPSHVVVPLGSGGTGAGLLAGLRLSGLRSRLLCVGVSDVIRLNARSVAALARRTLRLLRRHGETREAEPLEGMLTVESRWLGPGYGHPTLEGGRAMRLLAEREGVTLDPVYTAKAMAALLALNEAGAFGEGPVLYWHTYSPPENGNPIAPGRAAEKYRDPAAPGREAEEAAG